ncbi:MAG: hypothetical protein DRJ01_07085 [Bacteroidetes bacterium]|nr:MAG: hypothetical protein DRJ01_07085 [Bacteroidota bacterium]
MKKYNFYNNIIGWGTFLIAAFVYLSTIEPTTSFWDCGEFIATSFKLEVGHPPGAPLFMIIARFFSLFASDNAHVAIMINSMSALASAFTIMFLFWTITHLAKRIIVKNNEITTGNIIAILGSGLVGALAYTFSDSFWFSAVEGEVYASSSLFTAVVFWAILKWEDVANEKHANRWIILIAYLMGLSIGVHLLNLLTIPAIVFIYYFKKYEVTKTGLIKTSILSLFILGITVYGVIPGVIKLASYFELLFVNGFGMPYNSGVIFYTILLVSLIVWGLHYTTKHKKVILNTIILAFTVILIGYSSFAMIVIRSAADLPMDENNPENVFSLLAYLNREQYGDRPLVKGQYFNSPLDKENPYTDKTTYIKKDKKYVLVKIGQSYNYDKRFTTLFPRMYSSQKPEHIKTYKEWAKIKGTPITITNRQGERETINKPTFGENLKFFFKYQLGYMYFRYFMWNFAGRQNDIQGHGDNINGNWISGINFIDDARLGPQENLPQSMLNNKARNKYYMLPLLLGLIGLFFQYKKDGKNFWVVSLLFILTGIAIVVYLNQTPQQPRERDYAYAASFYAFAIWIGLGVLAIHDLLSKKTPAKLSAILTTILCLTFVPGIMASENWDDHDRSNRYTARDFASNYLKSCAKNAIIFTNGDNDTFPLWYAQEVEGIRTDIRVVNLSLLQTDWYIDQMKRKAYDSEAIPFSLTYDKYIQGTRDIVYIIERIKNHIDLKEAIKFVADDNPKTKIPQAPDLDYFPSKKFSISVDSAKVVSNGTVNPKDADKIVKSIKWDIKKDYVLKNSLMVLDLLANNDWERPIYFAITVGSDNYLRLEDYFQLEGLAYRLVPIKTKSKDGQVGRIATDIMYDNMMNKFKFGGINDSTVYLDENNLRMTMNLKSNFARLANALIDEGKKDSAIAVLDKCMDLMPDKIVPFDYFNILIIDSYYKAGEYKKANNIAKRLSEITQDNLQYFLSLPKKYQSSNEYEIRKNMSIMQELTRLSRLYEQNELSTNFEKNFRMLFTKYYTK